MINSRFLLCALIGLFTSVLSAREFSVMVYNVENLFDLDGVALYSQYSQHEGNPDSLYGVEPFVNKLDSIRKILATENEGQGPDVILFQEFELDRTPFDHAPSAQDFIQNTSGTDLKTLLEENEEVRRYPAELLLLKHLADHGIRGYQIAQPDFYASENHPPHKNITFSRFPIKEVRQRTVLNARDVLITTLDIDGHEFILFNNHWKSGASNEWLEGVRKQNAMVVRAEVDRIFHDQPFADILVGGDLNSHYNQSAVLESGESGINDILKANGSELLFEDTAPELYNLWMELPSDERGSDFYQGTWGTLMHIIISEGLYDRAGIQYVDNSFRRVILPEENVDAWGVPKSWTNFGGGAGYSDHLPIIATFRTTDEASPGLPMELSNPSDEKFFRAERPAIDFTYRNKMMPRSASDLVEMPISEQVEYFGLLFLVEATIKSLRPTMLDVNGMEFGLYAPGRELRDILEALEPGSTLKFIGELGSYRGQIQFVIRDSSWYSMVN